MGFYRFPVISGHFQLLFNLALNALAISRRERRFSGFVGRTGGAASTAGGVAGGAGGVEGGG
jgi:hypothetical protein